MRSDGARITVQVVAIGQHRMFLVLSLFPGVFESRSAAQRLGVKQGRD